jgi:4-amino-4-deoxy-L-arabinose transferase-like glycosyltransferase
MTTITPPVTRSHPPAAIPRGIGDRVRAALAPRERAAAWTLPATLGVLALAAILYLVNLTVSGYANEFYSAAAWAGSQSWSSWFFGSIDPANFITVDKPPLATMVMGLSVRLFGLSSAAILLPEALMGVATVGILMATVRRTFGGAASIIAGLVMALSPAAVLIFRYNNPDALLTLLLVGSAYTFLRTIEDGRFRWLVLTGLLVGLAFNTKLLQGWMVLPAFAITYALCAPGSIGRRVAGLAVSLGAVIAASSWWVVGMQLVPASLRPYVGGSTDGSALNLILGYNGLGRLFGGDGNGAGGGGGASFAGTPGLLRLFNDEMGGQIAWLLPASAVGFVSGLVARARARRTDLARAAYLMWGLWLATHALVFSFMSGTIHSYYVVVMAPAIGALVGGGLVALWGARDRHAWAGAVLGGIVLVSAALAWMLLDRTPTFVPGLGLAIFVIGVVVAVALTLPAAVLPRRLPVVALGLALAVLLAGPAAYAADTMATAYSGGVVSAGPPASGDIGGPGGAGGPGGGQPPTGTAPGGGQTLSGAAPSGIAPSAAASNASFFNQGGMGGSLDSSTIDYLVANRGTATWIVAVQSANTAAPIELSTGLPVMAMGGFTGSDPAPTLAQLKAYVASGELRFVMVGGGGGPSNGSSSVSSWVTTACKVVTVGSTTTSVYDCAGAATTGS